MHELIATAVVHTDRGLVAAFQDAEVVTKTVPPRANLGVQLEMRRREGRVLKEPRPEERGDVVRTKHRAARIERRKTVECFHVESCVADITVERMSATSGRSRARPGGSVSPDRAFLRDGSTHSPEEERIRGVSDGFGAESDARRASAVTLCNSVVPSSWYISGVMRQCTGACGSKKSRYAP